ncbi:MAG: DNA translocase FtsK 4TM domain-containing protein [Phaeodactylibacter sp.]|nr:DNA translocase FtsK 4TM domain-containing protein [Phaeodactylibacter sp.]MCB9302368.1 DNA translocase FtsK 4TM domain-containing protein [Lewinellaceae bacterium]
MKPIVEELRKQGWSVWWDRDIPHGMDFAEFIEEKLRLSKIIVAIWSEHSIKSRWVKTEANEGLEQNSLVPARIDEVISPLAFKLVHTADLVGWQPGKQHAEWNNFLGSIQELLEKKGSAARLLEEEEEWSKIGSNGTIDSYRIFLQKFPNGKYSGEAKMRISFLEEQNSWLTARKENTAYSYFRYTKQYPQGRYLQQANDSIHELEREEDSLWAKAENVANKTAFETYLKKYPSGRYKDVAGKRLQQISKVTEESLHWEAASKKDNISSYKLYLKAFPEGRYATQAQKKIKDKQEELVYEPLPPPLKSTDSGYLYKPELGKNRKKGQLSIKVGIVDDRVPKLFGILSLFLALYLFVAFTSYLFTWMEDQSYVLQFSWSLLLGNYEMANWLGRLGALISNLFFYWGFGLPSYIFIVILVTVGLGLIRRSPISSFWPKLRFWLLILLMASIFLGVVAGRAKFPWGGAFGHSVSMWMVSNIGTIGIIAFFTLALIGILVWNLNPNFNELTLRSSKKKGE